MHYLFIICVFTCIISFGQRSDFSEISFKKADQIVHNLKGENLYNLPVLTYKLTHELQTDVEKFRAIYLWICTNITNDYQAYVITKSKRAKYKKRPQALLKWNTIFVKKSIKKLLLEQKTTCTGYAYLLKEMTRLADIPCTLINGYASNANNKRNSKKLPNHSWNAVQLNDKWYLCDATWSAGKTVIKNGIPNFIYNYSNGYFLTEPMIFSKNHAPIDPYWLLPKNRHTATLAKTASTK